MPSKCPFCNSELINSRVHCPNNKVYPCQECNKCHSYFYTRNNYIQLKNLASKSNKKLNSSVYYFSESIFKPKEKSIPIKNIKSNNTIETKKKKVKHKNKIKQIIPKSANKSSLGISVAIESVKKQKKTLTPENCVFYKKNFCNYMDDNVMIHPLSVIIKNQYKILQKILIKTKI